MRILILGATGMLGHKLWQTLSPAHDVVATVRCGVEEAAAHGLFDPARLIGGVDAMRFATIERAVREADPQVVINAIGLIKQIDAARDPVACITLNALLPHQLAALCAGLGARLIHISTDCVFSGRAGMYDESMPPDPVDLYGRSKFMGEPSGPGALTLRTSLIGRELRGGYSLVEWFLAAQGPVRGFTQAFFSGFTTQEFSRLIQRIIDERPELEGLLHASAGRISKHDLLVLLREAFGLSTPIERDESLRLDRSLDSARLRGLLGYTPPAWPEMVRELAAEQIFKTPRRN